MSSETAIERLIAIMAALRTPGSGCPWDLAQDARSIARYAIEEAYEVVDAIERDDLIDLRDELGDLLLQVVFHARLAQEAGHFSFPDVVEAICAKLLRRHPHVFGPDVLCPDVLCPDVLEATSALSADAVEASWEAIKAAERRSKHGADAMQAPRGLLADVPVALPGLTRAVKLQRKAAKVGFDWEDVAPILAKIREEIDEIEHAVAHQSREHVAGEIGDLLFAVANLARRVDADPEAAVRTTNAKFERRFAFIEATLAGQGSSPENASFDEMDALWDEAKRQGL